MYALKTLIKHKARFALTILGVALCAILMLFLLSVYQGVAVGSLEYVRSSHADLWVLQRHSTNILRSTSLLSNRYGKALLKIEGVKSVSPIFFILASIETPTGPATIYLAGYDPVSGVGKPPALYSGKHITQENQMVIDHSFAEKYDIKLTDKLRVNKDTLTVVGISSGTNMFVIQYGFISLEQAYSIIGARNLVTCYQLTVDDASGILDVAERIRNKFVTLAVFDQEAFLANNNREMESGLLPLLFVVAFISAIVLTAILSLILIVNVIESRKDFAIMKAIGSPAGFISGMVIRQALILSFTGILLAILLFFPLVNIIEKIAPEVSTITASIHILTMVVSIAIISMISAIIPNRKLKNIYPLEVFK